MSSKYLSDFLYKGFINDKMEKISTISIEFNENTRIAQDLKNATD